MTKSDIFNDRKFKSYIIYKIWQKMYSILFQIQYNCQKFSKLPFHHSTLQKNTKKQIDNSVYNTKIILNYYKIMQNITVLTKMDSRSPLALLVMLFFMHFNIIHFSSIYNRYISRQTRC